MDQGSINYMTNQVDCIYFIPCTEYHQGGLMPVKVYRVNGRHELKQFIYLPEQIHRHHPQWVHPLYQDEFMFFDPAKNKSFASTDTILALAGNAQGRIVGRIMGIINPAYNKSHQENNARFCFLECEEDSSIAKALLDFVEQWAHEKGMARLVGPLCFSDKDPQGLLIEGFDERVVIATNYNFPWLRLMVESAGYTKEIDLVSYKVDIPETIPAYLQKTCERVIRNGNYILHEFTRQNQLRPWIVPIFNLINEAYSHIYGFIPLTEAEMNEFAERYIPVLNPKFIKVITLADNIPIAFLISMPELSEGIRKAKGRLWPVGWYHILREAKRTRMLTMLLGAIRENHRGKGLDALLAIKILESAHEAHMQLIDSHLILENNDRMRAEYERIGGRVHKRYRIFGKDL